MSLSMVDIVIFAAFIVSVVTVGIMKSRKGKTSEDYFLASRGLSWWLIGFSLIAANISTEQFIGMSGSAAKWLGIAIASYEWMAAITLIIVGFAFLPKFLKSGIYTIPEFLGYRYNQATRSIMAIFTVLIYVFVTFAAVVYSGAIVVKTLFGGQSVLGIDVNIATACWFIGILAAIYVVCGGLKACAWADLLQGSALIAGGALVLYFAMKALGSAGVDTIPELASIPPDASVWNKFTTLNAHKLHMVLPKNDPEIPWTALVLGLWIPNFYYWGLNQYITQRTLGSKSLAQGQKGIVFAAALKLIIPFIIVIPGMIAFNLYKNDMKIEAADTNRTVLEKFQANLGNTSSKMVFNFDDEFAQINPQQASSIARHNSTVLGLSLPQEQSAFESNKLLITKANEINKTASKENALAVQQTLIGYKYDSAFALLIRNLIPVGLRGFMLAAILGAVISSLAAMLNSASTIFTMDIFNKYINKDASQNALLATGRVCVVIFTVIGCAIAPLLDNPKFGGIFKYIQEFQGYISPGILAVFVFGLIVKKAPPFTGVVGLILNPILYFLLAQIFPKMAFLDRMAVTFFAVLAVMSILTIIRPMKEPHTLPHKTEIDLRTSRTAIFGGIIVIVLTLILYFIFW